MKKIIASEKAIKPGIYQLPVEDYHRGFGISRSGLLELKRTPYHYWNKYINPDYKSEPATAVQILGNALHTYVLEPDEFEKRYFVIPKFNKVTKEGKERWQKIKAELGKKETLSSHQYQILQLMAGSLKKNKLAIQLLENAQVEQSLYWTDPDTGILCKCRPDILHHNLVVDLKTTNDGSIEAFSKTIKEYGYHIQAAMIQEALKNLKQKIIKDFLFLIIEKKAPYATAIYPLNQASLEQGHYEFKKYLADYQQCLKTNEWPDYGIQEISLPRYAFFLDRRITMNQELMSDQGKLVRAELDMQITTAKAYPRNPDNFIQLATQLATQDEETAQSCFYCLTRKSRDGKVTEIKGALIRLAEIAAASWGNLHAASRIVENDGKSITAEGVAWDLERNVRISSQVKRSIVTASGATYGSDMQTLTGNAASSIALRNAIFKVIPKALIDRVYEKAVQHAVGDQKTLSTRRCIIFDRFRKLGIDEPKIFRFFNKTSIEEFTLADLEKLIGIGTSIKDGYLDIDKAFVLDEETTPLNVEERVKNLLNN
ncbi:MAG: Synechococcus phage [Pseudomonadota bacterium]